MERHEEVLVALRRIIRATDLHSKYLSKTAGLTAPQLMILRLLSVSGDSAIGELAKRASLSQATVTSILDRLEKRGYVARQRGEADKRKVYAYLTDAGLERLKSTPAPLQDSFIRQFQDLHDWEQTQILSSLQRIAQMMDASHIDASPVLDVGDINRSDKDNTPDYYGQAGATG